MTTQILNNKTLAIATAIFVAFVMLIAPAANVFAGHNGATVDHETSACGETTFTAEILDSNETHKTNNMYLVVHADGDTEAEIIPTDGSDVSITVGPFDEEDVLIQWRVWGGGERDYDQPLWNGYGDPDFTDDINTYGGTHDWDWVNGEPDDNPFVNWNEVEVDGCEEEEEVTICHAKGQGPVISGYKSQTLPESAVSPEGHSNHGNDIIPPFGGFDGQNWDDEGQAIWENGCKIPEPEPELSTLNVCKIIVDNEGNVIDGGDVDAEFSVDLMGPDEFATTTTFTTPLTLTDDLVDDNNDSLDAQCVSYDVPAGEYTYEEQEIDDGGAVWGPTYHDFFDETPQSIEDFFLLTQDGEQGDEDNADGVINLGEEDERTLAIVNTLEELPVDTATLVAHKIVCDAEEDLPNWAGGNNGAPQGGITETTAEDFVDGNNNCHLESGWDFQWAPKGTGGPEGSHIGEADGFTSFGPTNEDGVATTTVSIDEANGRIEFREVLQEGYIAFSDGGNNDHETPSAEIYCDAKMNQYDNGVWIDDPEAGDTINCVAFNVPVEEPHQCLVGKELLTNGGFENPVVDTDANWDVFPNGTSGLGWAVQWVSGLTTPYQGEDLPEDAQLELHAGVAGWNPFEGSQYTELDSDWFGPSGSLNGEPASTEISQSVPTVEGQWYEISFAYSPRPGVAEANNVLEVHWDGDLVETISRDGSSNSDTDWSTHTYTLEATSEDTILKLVDAGTPDSLGPFVDDVSVMCVECEIAHTIFSDSQTQVNDGDAFEITPHDNWTDIEDSNAVWIWTEEINQNGSHEPGTEVFTREFEITGTPAGATLTIAADNTYSVSVNGNEICEDSSGNNFGSTDECEIDAEDLQNGTNTITFTVENLEGSTHGNPGGLLYELVVDENQCVVPEESEEPQTGSVEITKYACAPGTEVNPGGDNPDCSLAGGVDFQFTHQPDKDDNGSYNGDIGDQGVSGETDENGKVLIEELSTEGRYLFQELDGEGEIAGDDDVLYFSCDDDTGNKSDNKEISFIEDGETDQCVIYNALEGDDDSGSGGDDGGDDKVSETIIVTHDTSAGYNQLGWLFARDPDNQTDYQFVGGNPSIGIGSLHVLPIDPGDGSDKFIAENFLFTSIADIESISYDFMIDDSEGATDSDKAHFYMNVYANFGDSSPTNYYDCKYDVVPTVGSTGSFTTVTFDPTQDYPVTGSGCPDAPADMDNTEPESIIRALSLNVGDTSTNDTNVGGWLDNVVVTTVGTTTTYDFEPLVSTETVITNESELGTPSLVGESFTVEWDVTPDSGSDNPTGTVDITFGGGTTGCEDVQVGTNGVGQCDITPVATSSGMELIVYYSGDDGFAPSQSDGVPHDVVGGSGSDGGNDDNDEGGDNGNGPNPQSFAGGNGPIGPISFSTSAGIVLGASTESGEGQVLGDSCEPLLTTYLRRGYDNNPEEVLELQKFLQEEVPPGPRLTAVFDEMTEQYVNEFQMKYADEILVPWHPHGLEENTPTGYVYKTTRRWVNLIHCSSLNIPFPILP